MTAALSLRTSLDPTQADHLAVLAEDPGTWLPGPASNAGPDHWQVYLWAGEVGVLVDCTVGRVWHEAGEHGRLLRWTPVEGGATWRIAHAVPHLEGDLCWRRTADGTGELSLEARYRPPGGVMGRLADRLVLHRLAHRTARQFLADVAAGLARQPH